MIQTFLLILPFGLAGAVSPVMLTEQTVLLATRDGKRAARRYAAGAALVLLVFTGFLVVFGRAISLPEEPKLDATLDIVIGVFLVGLALFLRKPRIHREKKRHHAPRFGAGEAFGFGAFSMATNFTTLALVVPAAKIIAASDLDFPLRDLLVVVLVIMCSTPAWLPVALTAIAPGPTERGLEAFGSLIERRGRVLTVALLGGLGVLLVIHGVFNVG